MTLKERLDEYKAGFVEKVPLETREVMYKATDDLRNSGIMDTMLKVSDKAPDFELPDSAGNPVALSALLEKGPVVLTFFRGLWWPYCNFELEALNQAFSEFKALGASLIAVSPQKVSFNRLTAKKLELDFPILADEGNALAERFGIRFALPEALQKIYRSFGIDVAKNNGDDSWTLPLAARYLIGQDGIIHSADVDPDYTVRTEPAETLQALKRLLAG